ncbi:hypothetical protein AB4Y63_09425 [Leifsonia sp. YAF41]
MRGSGLSITVSAVGTGAGSPVEAGGAEARGVDGVAEHPATPQTIRMAKAVRIPAFFPTCTANVHTPTE